MQFTFVSKLTPQDYLRAIQERGKRNVSRSTHVVAWVISMIAFLPLGFLVAAGAMQRSVPGRAVLIATVVTLLLLTALHFLNRVVAERSVRRSSFMTGHPRTYVSDDDGIEIHSPEVDLRHPWSAFSCIEEHGNAVHLMLDDMHFHPVATTAFASAAEKDAFVAHARSRISSSKAIETSPAAAPETKVHVSTPIPVESEPAQTTSSAGAAKRGGIASLTADALRIAFFRPVAPERLDRGWATVLLVSLLAVGMPTLVSVARLGSSGSFSSWTLPYTLLPISLILMAAVGVAYAAQRRGDVERILLAGALAYCVIQALSIAGGLIASGAWLQRLSWRFNWLPGAWLALALAVHSVRMTDARPSRWPAVALVVALALALPLWSILHSTPLWNEPFDADANSPAQGARFGAGGEDAFYRQGELLPQQMQSLRRGRPGVIDVFFVGMAGYGSQDVFMREVDATARLFRERFGAEGRTVRLVNNNKTLLDTPIASRTSLKRSLSTIAGLMDKDEDVLVLFLTSHGTEDHRFSLDLWPLRFHTLDPATVREALDQAGIRNRIVIVSACYSGGFLKALEGPDTLVITASAPDKNSFGCTNEAEWTYFGKAYFDEALRATRSFAKAFENAVPVIAKREAAAGFDGSAPQISVGSNIAPTLALLERQLEGKVDGPAREPAVARTDPYEAYVRLMFTAEYLEESKRACHFNMDLQGPIEGVRATPEAYGGMERSRRHWSRLNAAWDRYAKTACDALNDPGMILRMYSEIVREMMTPAEIANAIALVSTPQGKAWLDKDRAVVVRHSTELARVQAAAGNRLYKGYVDETNPIWADYRASKGN